MANVNFFGPINRLGMGVHFTGMVGGYIEREALAIPQSNGIFVSPKGPIGIPRDGRTAYERLLLAHSDPARFNPNNISMMFWHASDVSGFHGRRRILYTVWETDKLSPAEEAGVNNVDAIIVPTDWHADILTFRYSINKPVYVVPAGTSKVFSPYDAMGRRTSSLVPEDPEDKLVLCSVGKYEKRKGQREAIAALGILGDKAGIRIRLVAHWMNLFDPNWANEAVAEMMANGFVQQPKMSHGIPVSIYKKGRCEIALIESPLGTPGDMAALYQSSDYLLHPAFAEGWGLPISEAAACGIPSITQRWGAVKNVISESACIPLAGKTVIANDGKYFHGDRGCWSQTSVDSIVQAIEYASKNIRNATWKMHSVYSVASVYSLITVGQALSAKLEALK